MDRSEVLELARYEASAMSAPRRAPGQSAAVLHAAPRSLRPVGDAALAAWELAASGAAHGTAYRLADGWWWCGTADMGDAAVVLTIGPSGQRSAERYGSAADPEATQADNYFAEFAESEASCPTPANFAEIVAGRIPQPEPVAEPVAEPPAVARPVWPRPRSLAWRYRIAPRPAPLQWVAAVAEPERVAAPQLGRRTIREWLRDQVRASIGPWLAEFRPQIELPRLIHLDYGGPEPATT